MNLFGPITDGLNDQITFEEFTFSNNSVVTIKVKFNSIKAGGLLSNGALGNYIRLGATGRLRFRSNGNSALSEWPRTLVAGVWYVIEVTITPTGARLYIDDQYVGNSGGTITGFTANRAAMFNTTDFLPAVFEYIKIDDLNNPANNRHWINTVAGGSSLVWPDISGNGKHAELTNTPTDGTQWERLAGAVLTPISNFISTVAAFRSDVLSVNNTQATFRALVNKVQGTATAFRSNVSTFMTLATQFTQNALIQTTKAVTTAFRGQTLRVVPVASAMRSNASVLKPLGCAFRASVLALSLNTAAFRKGIERNAGLMASFEGVSLIDWNSPAKKVVLNLVADKKTIQFNSNRFSFNFSVNRVQI